jgi:hypothetical protein
VGGRVLAVAQKRRLARVTVDGEQMLACGALHCSFVPLGRDLNQSERYRGWPGLLSRRYVHVVLSGGCVVLPITRIRGSLKTTPDPGKASLRAARVSGGEVP